MHTKPTTPSERRFRAADTTAWQDSFGSGSEHFVEFLQAGQEDVNRLIQQIGQGRSGLDFAMAWSEFAMRRMSNFGIAFNEAVGAITKAKGSATAALHAATND